MIAFVRANVELAICACVCYVLVLRRMLVLTFTDPGLEAWERAALAAISVLWPIFVAYIVLEAAIRWLLELIDRRLHARPQRRP